MNEIITWPDSVAAALAEQRELSARVRLQDAFEPVRRVAGVDVGFPRPQLARAAVVVLDYPGLSPLEQSVVELPTRFPYRSGLLAYRELPAVLAALDRLQLRPDLLLCDGQGTAHPRRCGIACHLGVLRDLPCIGVAKSRLCGQFETLGEARGSVSPLRLAGETVGYALRSRSGCRPLFVSAGHRITQASAVAWALRCCGRYRLPETTRHAHRLVSG